VPRDHGPITLCAQRTVGCHGSDAGGTMPLDRIDTNLDQPGKGPSTKLRGRSST
jgi:hypothetical protein